MTNDFTSGTSTRQHPVDTGIENAKNNIEEASFGETKVADEDFEDLKKILTEIWDQNSQTSKIPDQFAPALFELVALTQFQRIKDGNTLWDKEELEKLVDSIWEIIERWLKPSTPKK